MSYKFTGSYENQVRAEKRLGIVLPIALFAIWLILYFQFKRVATTVLVFSGILFAWSGGFILLWLYGQPWFLDFSIFGHNLRDLFQMGTINLSVAVWVGFLALFGIATDNGVIVCTYLQQIFRERKPRTIESIRAATIDHPGPPAGAYLGWPRLRHHGAHGDPILWRYAPRDHYNLRRARALLRHRGTPPHLPAKI